MLEKLGWRSLQQRRADARLCLSSTVLSMNLWQYPCLNKSSPIPACPDIATQWPSAKSTPQQTITNTHFIPWQLSSGMLSQSGWCACQPLMRSRKQLVSCTTPGRISWHDAFNLILTLFSPTFNLSSWLNSLSYLALYVIYSSFILALTAHICLECLRRRMAVYKERKKKKDEQLFSIRWPLSYPNFTKTMKTYIRCKQHKQ